MIAHPGQAQLAHQVAQVSGQTLLAVIAVTGQPQLPVIARPGITQQLLAGSGHSPTNVLLGKFGVTQPVPEWDLR